MAGPVDDEPVKAADLSFEQAAGYLTRAAEWSARVDRFCAALKAQGFEVERDGWTVRIEIRPRAPQ